MIHTSIKKYFKSPLITEWDNQGEFGWTVSGIFINSPEHCHKTSNTHVASISSTTSSVSILCIFCYSAMRISYLYTGEIIWALSQDSPASLILSSWSRNGFAISKLTSLTRFPVWRILYCLHYITGWFLLLINRCAINPTFTTGTYTSEADPIRGLKPW